MLLKDCPFCGRPAQEDDLCGEIGDGPTYHRASTYIECQECGCLGPTGNGSTEAMKNWNTRR